jgi:hypothetical protein
MSSRAHVIGRPTIQAELMSWDDLIFGSMFWSALTMPFTAVLFCPVIAVFLVPHQVSLVERRIVTTVAVLLVIWSIPGLVLFLS